MCCSLRWLYNAAQLGLDELLPNANAREYCMSDEIEPAFSNSVQTIRGKAHLFASEEAVGNAGLRIEGWEDGDVKVHVRAFSKKNKFGSGPVRPMFEKELEHHLWNPSVGINMYQVGVFRANAH